MNFYIFSAQYLPTMGGVERYTNSLAKKLIEKGHSVTVVTSSLQGLPEEETDSDNIHIIRLPVIPVMGGRFPVIKPSRMMKFKKELSLNKPDFCVIQTRFYISSVFASYLCKKYDVPNVVIDHSTSHLMSGGLIGSVADMYEHFAAGFIKRRTDGFYGVSQNCVNWLKHFNIKPEGVLYNSVDPVAIDKMPAAKKADYGCGADQLLIVFAARLIEEKGVLKLVEAFNKMKDNDNAKLVIAGTGPLLESLEKINNPAITVTGPLPFEQVIGLYKAADVFCLPTDYPEGFPTTILEAAACKAVVVATDKGGTSEIITDENHGIIIKENTVENIKKALEFVCENEAYRNKCADNAHTALINNFTWDKTCEKLLQIAQMRINNGD